MSNDNSIKRELRFTAKASASLRGSKLSDGAPTIGGYAAVFNSLSEDLGGFREKISPLAFSRSLADGADVRALVNHDPNMIIGRRKSGTLRLMQDSVGLKFECDLPDTSAARDLLTSIQRGDIDSCSFGFVCMQDSWEGNVRTLLDCEIFDVSAVTYPAYSDTSVAQRSLFPDGQPESIAKRSSIVTTRTEMFGCRPVSELSNEDYTLWARLKLAQMSLD